MKLSGTEISKNEIEHATKADETLTFEECLKVGDFSQNPTLVMKCNESQLKQSYTLAKLSKMPDSELIDTPSKTSWNQIIDLFQFTQDTKVFYKNKERMNSIIDELELRIRGFETDTSLCFS